MFVRLGKYSLGVRRTHFPGLRCESSDVVDAGAVPDSQSLQLRSFNDPDERRGYKYDGTLDLSSLIDKTCSIGHIDAATADGFRSRNMRTGAEPPDPDKAKEIMLFFKNRPKLPKADGRSGNFRSVLRASRNAVGRAKEAMSQRWQRVVSGQVDGGAVDNSKESFDKTRAAVADNGVLLSRNSTPKKPSVGPDSASFPRGNYRLSKPPKTNK